MAQVRDPEAPAAVAFRDRGAEIVQGDLEDPQSVARVMLGASAVFGLALPGYEADPGRELRHGRAIVEGAERSGVSHLVYSSVSATGWRERAGVTVSSQYWDDKERMEEVVRASSVPAWTILKPAYFMENFLPPRAAAYYPAGRDGLLQARTRSDVQVPLVAARDIGIAAAAAVADRARFSAHEVELAGDSLTFVQIATAIGYTTGRAIRYNEATRTELAATGVNPGWMSSQEWFNNHGYDATPEHGIPFGLTPERFTVWAMRNRQALLEAFGN